MMEICKEVVDQTVKELRAGGFDISDEEVRQAEQHCLRKIKVAGKGERYFEMLFPDVLRLSIPEDIECDQFTKHDGGRRCAAYVYRIHVIADAQMLQNQSRYVYVLNVTKGSMKEISIWKV